MGPHTPAITRVYSFSLVSSGAVATRIRGVEVLLAVARGDEAWKGGSVAEGHQDGDVTVDTDSPNQRRSVEGTYSRPVLLNLERFHEQEMR